jgi:alkylhydroperoxidase family enzyme
MARIPYIEEETALPATAAALREIREQGGVVSPVQRALAHSVPALQAYQQLARNLSALSKLDPRTRELLILRTAQVLANPYAWRRHVPRATDAGLTEAELASIAHWWESACFSASERAVLQLVDEHLGLRQTGDSTIRAIRHHYGEELLIEILVTLGWYQLAATIMVPLDLFADDPHQGGGTVPFERAYVDRRHE